MLLVSSHTPLASISGRNANNTNTEMRRDDAESNNANIAKCPIGDMPKTEPVNVSLCQRDKHRADIQLRIYGTYWFASFS